MGTEIKTSADVLKQIEKRLKELLEEEELLNKGRGDMLKAIYDGNLERIKTSMQTIRNAAETVRIFYVEVKYIF